MPLHTKLIVLGSWICLLLGLVVYLLKGREK